MQLLPRIRLFVKYRLFRIMVIITTPKIIARAISLLRIDVDSRELATTPNISKLNYQMMIYVSALRMLHMRLKERASLRNGSLLV